MQQGYAPASVQQQRGAAAVASYPVQQPQQHQQSSVYAPQAQQQPSQSFASTTQSLQNRSGARPISALPPAAAPMPAPMQPMQPTMMMMVPSTSSMQGPFGSVAPPASAPVPAPAPAPILQAITPELQSALDVFSATIASLETVANAIETKQLKETKTALDIVKVCENEVINDSVPSRFL